MATEQVTHAWVQARALAYVRALLDPAESERVRDHLSSCGACSEALAAFERGPEDRPGAGVHVDPALLARWPEARRRLRGPERLLVRRHLERCEQCRQDLEVLGYAPELEVVAELERGLSPLASEADALARHPKTDDGPSPDAPRVIVIGGEAIGVHGCSALGPPRRRPR